MFCSRTVWEHGEPPFLSPSRKAICQSRLIHRPSCLHLHYFDVFILVKANKSGHNTQPDTLQASQLVPLFSFIFAQALCLRQTVSSLTFTLYSQLNKFSGAVINCDRMISTAKYVIGIRRSMAFIADIKSDQAQLVLYSLQPTRESVSTDLNHG